MVHLKENNRSNVLYKLAMVIGTMREDGSDSRLPVRKMPMGLVEYIGNFFAADNLQSVSKEHVVLTHGLYLLLICGIVQ